MLQQQQQQEVRVCGDSVCAQVLAGQVMDANNSAQPSFANHIGTAANSNSSSDEGSSSSTGTDMPAGASPAAAPAGGDLSASAWLSAAVGVPCKLVRQVQYSRTAKAHAALHSHQQQQQQVHAVGDGHGSSSAEQSLGLVAEGSSRGLVVGRANSSSNSSSSSSGQTAVFGNGSSTSSTGQTLGFANEAQYLLVNQGSVDYVAAQVNRGHGAARATVAAAAVPAVDALRFRPNLVVSGFSPWAEDSWSRVVFRAAEAAAGVNQQAAPQSLAPQQQHHQQHEQKQQQQQQTSPAAASVQLQVVGPCGRCDMVSIDQSTGQRQGNQLLALLARERRAGGKLQFGVLLGNSDAVQQQQDARAAQEVWLRVGDAVLPY
jgi:uncharacterized protein YcbX